MKDFIRKIKRSPYVSIILVAVNCIIFFLCQILGERLYMMGYLGVRGILIEQEYGRFIWSMFMHSDLQHLFNNMILLLFMGSMLEKIVGHLPYTVLYFLSGIGGGVLSLWTKYLADNWTVSIGASGAIFGLDGLLLAVVILLRDRVQDITPLRVGVMIGLSLYSGFTGDNIDNAAHVGGLLVGLVTGLIICAVLRIRQDKQGYSNATIRIYR